MTATEERPPVVRDVTLPRGMRTIELGPVSTRVHVRSVVVTVAVALLAIAVSLWSLTLGSAQLSIGEVAAAVVGAGDPDTARIVVDWRLSRIVFALLGGAALAIGGAVFQSITRNALGSPDIIGFSTGAYTGALLVALFATGSALGTSVGALVGGIATGLVVYLLTVRRGVAGARIIVVGIGVSLFLGAFNTWVLTTMRLEQAISAASWGAGQLSEIGWQHVVPVVVGLVACAPLLAWLAPSMAVLEMGDDAGRGLGVRAEVLRPVLLVAGVALVSLVTASAGPIAFVALAAPQLAMRMTGSAGVRILPSAVVGSALLAVSDLVARTIVAPQQLPTGVVTLCLGGAYLVWLLAASRRRRA